MVSDTAITVSFDGKLETIKTGDHRFEPILEALRDGRTDDIPNLIDPTKAFDGIEGVELVDGQIHIHGKKIPERLTNKVMRFKEKKLPFLPLLKFSQKLMQNPSFNSRQMLYDFLEYNGHPLTQDGNFIAYKKVRDNFKDCHTNTMDNSVGTTVEMPREDVDDNPNNTCSSGLHVAAYEYAKDFRSGHMVEVEIDPADVVTVPRDYNGQKMRVCKYNVVRLCESRLDDVELYEEDYDPNYEDAIEWGNY